MKFSTHMLIHFILAFAGSVLVYSLFKSLTISVICFASAILQDLDHIFEFWFAHGINLNPIDFWKSTLSKHNYFNETGKVHIFFHGWEYITIALVVGYTTSNIPLAVSFCVGYSLHLLWDQINFGKNLFSYSLIFRIKQGFNLDKIVERKI
jgi:hypothetical protein